MKFVVDTNVLSEFFAGTARAVTQMEMAEYIVVPTIVAGELLGGYRNGTRFDKNEAIFNKFLDLPIVATVDSDMKIAKIYAELFAFLKKNGTPIPQNDIWIAASAIAIGLPLYTYDSDFKYLPQVRQL